MSKQRVIVQAVLSGKSQAEVARLYGISQPRVSQLVKQWRDGGWDALEPRTRRPHTNPNQTPPHIVERILELRTQLTTDGYDVGRRSIVSSLRTTTRTPKGRHTQEPKIPQKRKSRNTPQGCSRTSQKRARRDSTHKPSDPSNPETRTN